MKTLQALTNINWIGVVKRKGDEWSRFSKRFTLESPVEFGAIRADSRGVCAIYVNGHFVEGCSGRYYNRITYAECTDYLKVGENLIEITLGGHFYEPVEDHFLNRRGSHFAAIAVELEYVQNGQRQTLCTDTDWCCESDEGPITPMEFSQVGQEDYNRFWKAAALMSEPKPIHVPEAVAQVAGEAYLAYVNEKPVSLAYPLHTECHGMTQQDGALLAKGSSDVIFDFGRIQVGYVQFSYEAEADCSLCISFDYTESLKDFTAETPYRDVVKKLDVHLSLKKGSHSIQLVRRRACRFLKIAVESEGASLRLKNVAFRLSMLQAPERGWFSSSEELLNRAWEVGKYTLAVNKHQEYESCPRNEMKFFSGDGIIAALVDYYAYGDGSLVESCLAQVDIADNVGLRSNVFECGSGLYDYPALRILMAYNHYRYTGDKDCIRRYYPEFVSALQWMIQKTNRYGLIYQFPIYAGPFYADSNCVEFSQSRDRLGEKGYLNGLLYQCLVSMSELAEFMNDSRGAEWAEMAKQVRQAINDRLWSEEEGAYLDTFATHYIPQDANAMALLFGIADKDRAKTVMATLEAKNWSSCGSLLVSKPFHKPDFYQMPDISPVACMYEAEGRFLQGDAEGGLELIRRCWGTMVKKGAGTFWEYAPNDTEERWDIPSHGWSSGCTYLLSAYVLGIRPAAPGYARVLFAPAGVLDRFAGVVPTVKGLIAVRCSTQNGKQHYTLALPEGAELETVLPDGAELTVLTYKPE